MKNFIYYVAIVGGLFFFSCTNDDVLDEVNNGSTVVSKGVIEFAYKGENYISAYKEMSDTVIFANETTGKLYFKLLKLPSLSTVVDSDGSIEFYDSFEDASKVLFNKSENKLRAYPPQRYDESTLYLYEHPNMTGNVLRFDKPGTAPDGMFYNYNLKDYGFDESLSSFVFSYRFKESNETIVRNYFYVTLFRDINCGGNSITFKSPTMTTGEIRVNDLYQYTIKSGSLFSHSIRWDNRVSSIKVSY